MTRIVLLIFASSSLNQQTIDLLQHTNAITEQSMAGIAKHAGTDLQKPPAIQLIVLRQIDPEVKFPLWGV